MSRRSLVLCTCFIALPLLACYDTSATEIVTQTVHVTGEDPALLEHVALWAEKSDGSTVIIGSWPVERAALGRFELSAEVDVTLCAALTVHGVWSDHSFGLLWIEETKHCALHGCGEHDIVLVRED
jgi:hypothetical protein